MTDPPPSSLTPRQITIAELVGEGFNTKQIADRLTLSERSVQAHVVSIAYLVSPDHGRDDRIMVARWWWEQHPRPQAG